MKMGTDFHTTVEFDEPQICLQLPNAIAVNGWEFVPSVTPLEVSILKIVY